MSVNREEYVFTRQQVRTVDQEATERYGIPGIVLMENASRSLTLEVLRAVGWPSVASDANVLIICGGGNNGGDGLAAARHLHNVGLAVTIVLTKPANRYTGDAEINLNICRAMQLDIHVADEDPVATLDDLPEPAIIVDGLLGTGLSSEVRAPADGVIDWINRQDVPVIAIDIPSGLDSDTGKPLGCAVRADATVTFVGVKRGFLNAVSRDYIGNVTVGDIGVPRELVEKLGQPMPV